MHITNATCLIILKADPSKRLAYLCTVCPSYQTRHLTTQLTGCSNGIERNGGQLFIVVFCHHQGALKPLEETGLLEKMSTSQYILHRYQVVLPCKKPLIFVILHRYGLWHLQILVKIKMENF